MLSKIIHETKTKGNILKILLQQACRQPACMLQACLLSWTGRVACPGLDLECACGWAQPSALACPSPPRMPEPPVLRVWHRWGDTLRHTLGSSCFMPDWSKYSTFILVLPNWLPSPRIAISTARTFICLMQCDFQPTAEELPSHSGFQGQKWQTIFIWK